MFAHINGNLERRQFQRSVLVPTDIGPHTVGELFLIITGDELFLIISPTRITGM